MLKRLVLVVALLFCVADLTAVAAAAQPDPVARSQQLIKFGKLREAENLLRSASQANPASPELHGLLGEILLKQQRYEEAVQELGTAAQAKPDSPNYSLLLSEALIGWQHFQVAIDYLNAVKARFDGYPQFHYDLGFAEYNEGHIQDARREFEKALKLAPKLAQARFLLASCMTSQGEFSDAESILSQLVTEYPKKAAYWAGLAQVLSLDNKHEDALRASLKAMVLAPKDAHVQFVRATVLMQSGDVTRAVRIFEKLEHLDGSVMAVHLALARLYRQQGRTELAHKESELARQLQQRNAPQDVPETMGSPRDDQQ